MQTQKSQGDNLARFHLVIYRRPFPLIVGCWGGGKCLGSVWLLTWFMQKCHAWISNVFFFKGAQCYWKEVNIDLERDVVLWGGGGWFKFCFFAFLNVFRCACVNIVLILWATLQHCSYAWSWAKMDGLFWWRKSGYHSVWLGDHRQPLKPTLGIEPKLQRWKVSTLLAELTDSHNWYWNVTSVEIWRTLILGFLPL